MKSRVLIIHNDPNLCAEIKTALYEATIIFDTAFSPSEAIDLFLHYDYSLILFDTDTGGKEIIKPLRAITSVPIIALCGQNTPRERCAVLRNGASVCLGTPIDLEELTAQIKALLSLYNSASVRKPIHTLAFGTDLVIDPDFRMTFFEGVPINLTRREFDLLFFLARNDKRVFTKQQQYEQVWGYEPRICADDAVRFCIKQLRKKLGPTGRTFIQTVRGVGYRFMDVTQKPYETENM